MADYIIKGETLSGIADAIRSKTGETESIAVEDMSGKIEGIEGGTDTSDATAIASDIMSGKTAYAKGSKITGSFSLDSEISTQDNLISQIVTALEGKAAGGGGGGDLSTYTVSITFDESCAQYYGWSGDGEYSIVTYLTLNDNTVAITQGALGSLETNAPINIGEEYIFNGVLSNSMLVIESYTYDVEGYLSYINAETNEYCDYVYIDSMQTAPIALLINQNMSILVKWEE